MQPALRESPFDVLWEAVASLDANEQIGKLRNLFNAQARSFRVPVGDAHFFRAPGHANDFARFSSDGEFAHGACGLINFKMVHFTLAAHHRLAETEVGINNHLTQVTVDRVDAEADARDFALHHVLHDDRHHGQEMVETVLLAIGHRAVAPQ